MENALFWCSGCSRNLPSNSFYYRKNGARKGERDARCKECRSRYYHKHKGSIDFDGHRLKRKALIDAIVNPLKKTGCVDCSQVFVPEAMDLDHVRGTKQFSISYLERILVSDAEMIELLKAELELCEVCCANCHRRRTTFRHRTSIRLDYLSNPTLSKRLNEKYLYAYGVLSAKGCTDCGNDDLLVLEFDHVRGTKTENLSTMLRKTKYSLEDVVEEVAKCDIRCVVCHRTQTFQRHMKPSGNWLNKGAGKCACGAKKERSATTCQKCYNLNKRKLEVYPTLEEITIGVETYGWVQYSKTVGLSDNGVRKLARRLGADPLPQKKR